MGTDVRSRTSSMTRSWRPRSKIGKVGNVESGAGASRGDERIAVEPEEDRVVGHAAPRHAQVVHGRRRRRGRPPTARSPASIVGSSRRHGVSVVTGSAMALLLPQWAGATRDWLHGPTRCAAIPLEVYTDPERAMNARPIDADNHHYSRWRRSPGTCPRVRDPGGAAGGRRTQPHPVARRWPRLPLRPEPQAFDPIIVPGCLDLFFRGRIPDDVDRATLQQVEPMRAEYRDRDVRIKVMDEQGLDAVLLVPDARVRDRRGAEDDVPATMAQMDAYNRWLEETWGFASRTGSSRSRCSRSPTPTRRLPRSTGCSRRGPASCTSGRRRCPASTACRRSLGNKRHDPVWARRRGRRSRGVPPRRQRLQHLRRGMGAQRQFEGFGKTTSWAASWCRTGRSTTRWQR